jgi:hypothetical protein
MAVRRSESSLVSSEKETGTSAKEKGISSIRKVRGRKADHVYRLRDHF